MDPPTAAPKKFSFSFKKGAAQISPQTGDAKGVQQRVSQSPPTARAGNERGGRPPVLAHAFGFEAPGKGSEKPKGQLLLSISGGQLEVEGASVPLPPRIIPCRNPLPLSKYRFRITGTQDREEGTTQPAEAGPADSTDNAGRGEKGGVESQAPAWGLQVMKRVKKDTRDGSEPASSQSNARNAIIKTEPNRGPLSSDATNGLAGKVKTESPSQGRVTDEEVAAALIAEARGESASSRVVPLLARNAALAEIRQKYRGDLERGHRQPQQAGEPDKQLLQRELELLPDAPLPSSAAYEAMPVEEFGAAMLRGMGLTSIPSASPPPKRKAYSRAGLGSEQEVDRLRERLEQQRRHEEAAKRKQKTFISLRTDVSSKD